MLRKWVIALVYAGTVYSGSVLSMGLGQVNLHSALNQPLNATIDLVDTKQLTSKQIIPLLGSAKDFKRARVARPAYLETLQFKTVNKDGKLQVQVSSKEPMKEPFVSFLLEVRWPKGRLLREYTVLLDPPAFGERDIMPAVSQENAEETDNQRASHPTYDVKKNDSLWDIARQFVPDEGFSIEQMMQALQKMNPHAFMQGDPDKLKKSVTLIIPTEEEILVLTGDNKRVPSTTRPEVNSPSDVSAALKKEQLKQLTSENMKLVNKLKQLEGQIQSLENIVSDKDRTDKGRTAKPLVMPAQAQKEAADKKSVQPHVETIIITDVKDGATTTLKDVDKAVTQSSQSSGEQIAIVSGKQGVTEKALSPKEKSDVVKPHSKPAPATLAEKKTSWYDMLMRNLDQLSLGLAGVLLLILLGWSFLKRRKQRQEEKEMDAILEAEAVEEEQKAQTHVAHTESPAQEKMLEEKMLEKNSERAIAEDSAAFSELVSASEKSAEIESSTNPSPKSIETKATPEEAFEQDDSVETLLAAEEEDTLSLNMSEDDVLGSVEGSDDKNIIQNNKESLSPVVDQNHDQASNERISEDESETLAVPEMNEVVESDDISMQLEQIDAELSTLSEEFSLPQDEEVSQETEDDEVSDENTSMASLLDLARAYLEMDDTSEAKDILKKVLKKGNDTEKTEAEALLKRC